MIKMNLLKLQVLALTCVVIMATGCVTENNMHGGFAKGPQDVAFDQGAERAPTAKTLSVLGRILAKKGKDRQAEFVFKRIISEHAAYLPAYVDLTELYMRTGRFGDATHVLASGLSVAPEDATLLNNMAMCHLIQGHYKQALPWFERAVSAAPADARYQANQAVALGMIGRYEESLAAYEGVLLDPAEAHYNVAVLCEARGDYDRAIDEYARAGLIEPMLNVKDDINRVSTLR